MASEEVDDETLSRFLQAANWETLISDPDVKNILIQIKKKVDSGGDGMDIGSATRIKLVVVGDGAVGKTCLLISFATDKFPEEYIPTVFENYTAQMKLSNESILLHLWDTAGQEEYDRLRPLSYPGADVVLLCFSLVHRPSYEAIRIKWYPEIRHYIPNVPYMLVGTKLDLREHLLQNPSDEHDLVSTELGQAMCDEIKAIKYVEASAKTKQNLDKIFHDSVTAVLEINGVAKPGASGSEAVSSPVIKELRDNRRKKGGCFLL